MDCTLEPTKCTLDKNETSRFLGDGVSFKAKLIGILEVSEARGDRMCQEALSDLKMAIRAAGEHKQRITINIAIDGLRLRDEKTGDSLYHHPVHKISFIAQDMTDSRAFGYIFGSPDTGHRFFGIKTDKAASQVVIAMRDLFQVVFALKKKEIELAKQHLGKDRYGSSALFSETSLSSSKFLKNTNVDNAKSSFAESKAGASASDARQSPAVADLVDLELELNSLQQGLTQMERITPSDPFGSKDDPFGDSFINIPPNPLLPPPPSTGRERASRTASDSSCIFSPKTPHIITIGGASSSLDSGNAALSTTPSDNLFHSKTDQLTGKEFSFPEFNSSHDDPSSSGGWFTPPADATSAASPSPTPALGAGADQAVDQHELTKQEIMSQFDVFTELDPLEKKNQNDNNEFQRTGKSKPYIDKKHFFRELKNPPKKALNDLVPSTDSPLSSLFPSSFQHSPTVSNSICNVERPRSGPSELLTCNVSRTSATMAVTSGVTSHSSSGFTVDPFGEDPFDQSDPFAEADFSKQDPFESEFAFKLGVGLARSPINSEGIINLGRQFDKESKLHSFRKLHENPSLDLSSESETAPEPPPRPQTTLTYIKPPPLPPKKQVGINASGDMLIKPPPRPPHTVTADTSHYDYIEAYETGHSSGMDSYRNRTDEITPPPLPAPARKTDLTNDFSKTPETLKPMSSVSEEEEYLTPIAMPTNINKKYTRVTRNAGPVLLPPPQNPKKLNVAPVQVTIASILENKPSVTNTTATLTMDSLDITLSQLTLSGLNELATKLNIPASQLSNMTLVQLTNYLSNFIKNGSGCTETSSSIAPATAVAESSSFQADFAANFSNVQPISRDRYAVFRELLEDEMKQSKIIDSEPREVVNEQPRVENTFEDTFQPNNFSNKFETNFPSQSIFITNFSNNISVNIEESTVEVVDKYAALRDIVNSDLELCIINESNDSIALENDNDEDTNADTLDNVDGDVCKPDLVTDITVADTYIVNETELAKFKGTRDEIIDFKGADSELKDTIEIKKEINTITPEKSPIGILKTIKSPVPIAITDLVQSNTRLTSGSLSDAVSGSSPEIDNTGSTPEAVKKNSNTTGESWAIFEQPNNNNNHQHLLHSESLVKDADKNIVSEEGVSPWSSDSKEYGNGSPPEWRQRLDSESGGERRPGQLGESRGGRSRGGRDNGGWWEDDGAEDKGPYYPANRRSTDSYDDDTYNDHHYPPPPPLPTTTSQRRYQRGHRPAGTSTSISGGGAGINAQQQQQSSSSRDASPWEEEDTVPRRRWTSGGSGGGGRQHSGGRPHTFDRHGGSGRRQQMHREPDGDSWDEEDDYEYEEEHAIVSRFHYPPIADRSRDLEGRGHGGGGREPQEWAEDWADDGRGKLHRRSKRDMERDSRDTREQRWCCPDRDQSTIDKSIRYASATSARYTDSRRKHGEDRYYAAREAQQQESPWEDEYNNGDEPQPHYIAARRNWKRPSSATDMDRKSDRRVERDRVTADRERDGRGPYYMSTGGSDGERDRRYKNSRRSKSRDSQYSEPNHSRHKTELNTMSMRRAKPHHHSKGPPSQFESDFIPDLNKKGVDGSSKDGKCMPGRKKSKESPKSDEMNTFPRKSARSQASLFENDFVPSESDSPVVNIQQRFHFDAEFETSEAESPTIRPSKSTSSRSVYYSSESKPIKSASLSSANQFEPSIEFSRRQRNQFNKDAKLKSGLMKDSNGSGGKSSFRGNASLKQQKSLFEDDFSPSAERKDDEPQGISSIQEEYSMEDDDSFATNDFNRTESTRNKRLSQRFSNNIRCDGDNNIKKSESVNIFAREDDPFDDDFFSVQEQQEKS